jgi:two-component system, OmpR family, sensor kinase
VASLGSSIRSAARDTSSAYRRLPIRWRLAGGSAALTLVILCGFAAIVGVLTTQQIQRDFSREVSVAADQLAGDVKLRLVARDDGTRFPRKVSGPSFDDYIGSQNAAVRVITPSGDYVMGSHDAPNFGPYIARRANVDGWRVESRPVEVLGYVDSLVIQYARRLSTVQATANRVKVFLAFGVLGGGLLALLAGLATARRAMEPIAEMTAAAREVERSRDPTVRIPHPDAEDEVAELARTLESMLGALGEARAETEATLTRQREFVADASHELRTPLTSVLANLELLEEYLDGEQREAAASALRSSRRMRRLVADLLLLARADAGRETAHEPVDVSSIVTDAAAELEPVAGDHEISISAPPGMVVDGARDELHRLILNLMENALRHTDPGTAVEAQVERVDGVVVLAVEDDGPGIPDELRDKVFERFFRGSSDRGGSSGLGLSIVRAVTESHHGTVGLEPPLDGRGARFVVRLPARRAGSGSGPEGPDHPVQLARR